MGDISKSLLATTQKRVFRDLNQTREQQTKLPDGKLITSSLTRKGQAKAAEQLAGTGTHYPPHYATV